MRPIIHTRFDGVADEMRGTQLSAVEGDVLERHLWSRGEDGFLREDLRFRKTPWARWTLSSRYLANDEVVRGLRSASAGQLSFVRQMAKHFRLKLSTAAVLVPTSEAGTKIAAALEKCGLPVKIIFTGRELDLAADVVKVITLHSAKGLEFSVVAVCGFAHIVPPATTGVIPVSLIGHGATAGVAGVRWAARRCQDLGGSEVTAVWGSLR